MAGELKARDVRFKLKGRVDPILLEVLETLAEQQNQLAKNQGSTAMLVDQMADITTNFVGVAEQMKKTIEKTGKQEEDDEKLQ